MTLEEKINYWKNYRKGNGLPEGISLKEYLSRDMLEWIMSYNKTFPFVDDIKTLYTIYKDDENYLDFLNNFYLVAFKNGNLEYSQEKELFDYILNMTSKERFIKKYVDVINKCVHVTPLTELFEKGKLVFSNTELTDLFMQQIITNKRFIDKIFNEINNKDIVLKMLSKDEVISHLSKQSIGRIIYIATKYNIVDEMKDLIENKIKSLKYEEIIEVLTKEYNPDTNEPEFLSELYSIYKEEVKKNKIIQLIKKINENSKEELKNEVRYFINTPEGMDIFLCQIVEPKFSEILNLLNLGNEYYELKKNNIFEKLNNYQDYSLDSVKDLFCQYCFNEVKHDTMLKIKTILEYAKENKIVKEKILGNIMNLIKISEFLTCTDYSINPVELINIGLELDLNQIIKELHEIFSKEIKDKTNITEIIKDRESEKKIVNNKEVKIYNLDDLPLEKCNFLIHVDNDEKVTKEKYEEKSKKHNKICMSVFDDKRSKGFIDGITFGYCNVDAILYSATHYDGQTNQNSSIAAAKPQGRSTLTSFDKFMDNTKSYNELAYFTNYSALIPSYILVINREINEDDLAAAAEFDIPIIVYHSKLNKNTNINITEQKDTEEEYKEYLSDLFEYEGEYINVYPSNLEKKNRLKK